MMRWRCRTVQVANRHALRSDYYSTTQKTANPLNEWWTTTEQRDDGSTRRFASPRRRSILSVRCEAHSLSTPSDARNACGAGISRTQGVARADASTRLMEETRGTIVRANDRRKRFAACAKFFPLRERIGSTHDEKPREASESAQVIRGTTASRDTSRAYESAAIVSPLFKCRACGGAVRSPPAGWRVRPMRASPGRRTSRSAPAWLSPAPLCRDWR